MWGLLARLVGPFAAMAATLLGIHVGKNEIENLFKGTPPTPEEAKDQMFVTIGLISGFIVAGMIMGKGTKITLGGGRRRK
jgi:uncharacterized protein YneF (UPF0154 family)